MKKTRIKKTKKTTLADDPVMNAASLLGKRSVKARKRKWGIEGYLKKQREYGTLGGRPPKTIQQEKN